MMGALIGALNHIAPPDHEGRNRSSTIRVKSEAEWPKYDGCDIYYDWEEFWQDFSRVAMLVSGGRGLPPHESLEMLRAALSGAPLSDFKTYIDKDYARNNVLLNGSPLNDKPYLVLFVMF